MRKMRTAALGVVLATAGFGAPAAPQLASADGNAQVVIAMIDTGINPYNKAFRDYSPLAYVHPSTYIPGYPAITPALNLSLDAPDLATALQQDDAIWSGVTSRMYWVPGTRIVGLINKGNGGSRCAPAENLDFFPANGVGLGGCGPERDILDDHGHGTMTASRAAGGRPDLGVDGIRSLGSEARIVAVEGTSAESVTWVVDRGWIDVQTNSWAEIIPHPVGRATDRNNVGVWAAFNRAAAKMMVFAASGNGAGGFFGGPPTVSYMESTARAGVIVVGAHDNGRIDAWSGAPANVVADGYAGWMARHDNIDGYEPNSIACCTSASAPYAAGGAANIILEARRILGASGTGIRNGVVAQAPAGHALPVTGPLADGTFTMAELRDVYLHTAEARPDLGRDDGLLNYTGDPRLPTEEELHRGPGANPYCNACQAAPVRWTDVDPAFPAYLSIGYGAINERSVALAAAVLNGATMPARPEEDLFFALDQLIRTTV